MTTNDVSALHVNQAQYSLMCYPEGGVVDDLLVYRLDQERYMLVVNASNIEKDWAWLQQHMPPGNVMRDISEATVLIALQGPQAESILTPLCSPSIQTLAPFYCMQNISLCGTNVMISRTGYTGEDGFEIYIAAEEAPQVWKGLLDNGSIQGLLPVGLGARDTLRFEARLPLYGQELSASISPLEAGLHYFVRLEGDEFIGKDALVKQKKHGIPRKCCGIELLERGIPRAHYELFCGDIRVGEVTSGTQSPTLKRNLGLALIDLPYTEIGTRLEIDIRGKRLQAEVVSIPFYKRPFRKGAEA
ncbi:Aminomethyltransferase [compost metagenome]